MKPRWLLSLGLLLYSFTGLASNVIDLTSQYLGNGVFQYRLNMHTNQFVTVMSAVQFDVPCTNRVSYGTLPANWLTGISQNGNQGATWVFPGSPFDGTAGSQTFLVESAQRNFRLDGALITFSYSLNEVIAGPADPGIQAAFLTLPCLIPCTAAEVDGSSASNTAASEFVPDIMIQKLNFSGGDVVGLTYAWNHADATVQLEASTTLKSWTPVGQYYGPAGTNTITSPTPLNGAGNFFRLSLLGTGPPTNSVINLTSGNTPTAALAPGEILVSPVRCRSIATGVSVEFPTVAGAVYQISLRDFSGSLVASRQVVADGETVTMTFARNELPTGGYFRVVRRAVAVSGE